MKVLYGNTIPQLFCLITRSKLSVKPCINAQLYQNTKTTSIAVARISPINLMELVIITFCENWLLWKISEGSQEDNWDRVFFICPEQLICRLPKGRSHMKNQKLSV